MSDIPVGTDFLSWLLQNEQRMDWQLFSDPWDQMQRKHNPFRDEQIDAILQGADILEERMHTVLDLGCGPGILGRRIHEKRPNIGYFGADGDPLMLAALRNLFPSPVRHSLLVDIRSHGWLHQYRSSFDAVVSLTALHWLTKPQLVQLYAAVFDTLKPGGLIVIGDPYIPEPLSDRKELIAFQEQYSSSETGMTWDDFWAAFYEKYPIKNMRASFQDSRYGGDLFQGSDDGYPILFYLDSLKKTGFLCPSVLWKKGLRVVYQGKKPS
jgi:SAM-dependent methyltransferase